MSASAAQLGRIISAAVGFAALSLASLAGEFAPPMRLTDGSRKYQMSRTANHVTAFDAAGRLHATYWSGGITTTPATPSHVYYRSWTALGGWTPEESIDDSAVMNEHVGGRHPSLAVAPNGTVWIVWHDHRHCTAVGSWIDNTEIYADFKPPGGAFSLTDLRMTTSSAPHIGDNGYTPKIVADALGRLNVCWYDFHEDPNVSDIYITTSDVGGQFPAPSMSAMQLTHAGARGGAPEFTVPDLAVDSSGTRHMVWVGGQGSGGNLYYASAPIGATSVTETLLASGAADFFDPPHITAAPNDDIWIAYGDDSAAGGENLVLRRRRRGAPAFEPPIVLLADSSREYAPDLKVDDAGRLHLAWIDERSGIHVYYGQYDPSIGGWVREERLTLVSGFWARPTLELGPGGSVFILFEESGGIASGDIWYTINLNSALYWTEYR